MTEDDWAADLTRLLRDGLVLVERDWIIDTDAVPRFRVTRRGETVLQDTTADETEDHPSRCPELGDSNLETTQRRVG